MECIVECPHCNFPIIIEKLNCRIFRHGVLKTTLQQINPHLSKIECDGLVEKDLIYGCGNPFQIRESGECVVCDYI